MTDRIFAYCILQNHRTGKNNIWILFNQIIIFILYYSVHLNDVSFGINVVLIFFHIQIFIFFKCTFFAIKFTIDT